MALTASQRLRYNLLLSWFGFWQVPLIGLSGARVVDYTPERCVVRLPLRRRNRNHLGSMYFGALAIGADTAGALVALFENRRRGNAASIVFKDFTAQFLKRPEGDTLFTCKDGAAVCAAFDETLRTGERVNVPVRVVATTPDKLGDEPVAVFALTLSLKRRAAK
jgi:acyl-coenzyme A thioesterase PaaI-like protein